MGRVQYRGAAIIGPVSVSALEASRLGCFLGLRERGKDTQKFFLGSASIVHLDHRGANDAAGDVRAGSTKRVGFAVADGSLAVTCVHRLTAIRT